MKKLFTLFALVHALIALLFAVASLLLVALAVHTCWMAIAVGLNDEAVQGVIEALGLTAIAVVALQIAQTITEEEIIREAHISAPTRVRRYLSRFLVVIVIALAIEGLVALFKASHGNLEKLPHAASILLAVGGLLAGWGCFIWCNRCAEELEPEAMHHAKSEDKKLR
jgi:hypothetical protein